MRLCSAPGFDEALPLTLRPWPCARLRFAWGAHPLRSQLPLNDPRVAMACELLEHEIAAGLPWRSTEAFISCVNDKSRLLHIDLTAGDPTGRGHSFAYVLRSEPIKPFDHEQIGPKQPEMGTITGSDSDLRKLSNDQARKILLDFGISPEIVNATTDRCERLRCVAGSTHRRRIRARAKYEGWVRRDGGACMRRARRWKRIDMVRKLCTAAGSDGIHSELTRRFTRVVKYTFADHVAMLKTAITSIWEAQVRLPRTGEPAPAHQGWLARAGAVYQHTRQQRWVQHQHQHQQHALTGSLPAPRAARESRRLTLFRRTRSRRARRRRRPCSRACATTASRPSKRASPWRSSVPSRCEGVAGA